MAEALRDGAPPVLFVEIEHPNGTGYFHSGIGRRTWNGQTWYGAGRLGSVSPIKQSSEIAIQDISFKISGVDQDELAKLGSDVRNLAGRAWLACVGPDDQVIADPYQTIDSELDYQIFSIDDDGTATIEIVAHSGFYTLDRGVEEAWTPENQKLTYPLCTGLDGIPALQHKDLKWRRSS